MRRRERGARADNETEGAGGEEGGREKSDVGEDAAEIPVSYDKRDNGLSNYPVKRLNRTTMKFVLSASFFSIS